MPTTIKAIETVYKGYRFRSRLEARWAVFFDAMGIRYRYEHEGYDMPQGGYYLPDFYLPDFNTLIEIKPTEPSRMEKLLIAELEHITEMPAYIISGEPWPQEHAIYGYWLVDMKSHLGEECYREVTCDPDNIVHQFAPIEHVPLPLEFSSCSRCNEPILLAYSDTEVFHWNHMRELGCNHYGCNRVSPRAMEAFNAARSARFEHGEKPRI